MPATAIDFAQAWEDAHKASITEPVQAQASFLLETVGPRIASAALGLADARQLKRWASDGLQPREFDVESRLHALYWMVRAIATCYTPAVAARFLRSANPQLDDEAPLVTLASATTPEAIRRVLVSTRAFLEG